MKGHRLFFGLMTLLFALGVTSMLWAAHRARPPAPARRVDTRLERVCAQVEAQGRLAAAWSQSTDPRDVGAGRVIGAAMHGAIAICQEPAP